jgi:hypothetical protein
LGGHGERQILAELSPMVAGTVRPMLLKKSPLGVFNSQAKKSTSQITL